MGQTRIFYILFNTIPPYPSQTGEGDSSEGKVEKWRESM